ncbi:MAG: hypothetical protein NTX97_14205 [Bacteroidetes bacterium]|nr:hypothetical protein [Bacteroidota bacterium]
MSKNIPIYYMTKIKTNWLIGHLFNDVLAYLKNLLGLKVEN